MEQNERINLSAYHRFEAGIDIVDILDTYVYGIFLIAPLIRSLFLLQRTAQKQKNKNLMRETLKNTTLFAAAHSILCMCGYKLDSCSVCSHASSFTTQYIPLMTLSIQRKILLSAYDERERERGEEIKWNK